MPEFPLQASVPDGTVEAKLFLPTNIPSPWPVVVFYMDALGLRPAMSEMAQRLADAGYAVVQPNLYWRSGPYAPFDPHTAFSDPTERKRIGALMNAVSRDQVVSDTKALLAELSADHRLQTNRIGVVGYCMGGRMAFVAAVALGEQVAAAAPIHAGGLVTSEADSPYLAADKLRCAMYLGVADKDNSCTPEHQTALQLALEQARVRYHLELNPGALHGYAVPDFPVYDRAAAEKHWERILALFAREIPTM